MIFCADLAAAETIRVATYNADLSRTGPGLLLRDIAKGEDAQIDAAVQVIAALNADVLVLTAVDYDHDLVALQAFADLLAKAGTPYPHLFALAPNSGMATGLDLDGNSYYGDARDAMGYGQFSGQAGMAVLSRLPVRADEVRDFTGFLWRDLPGALLPPDMSAEVLAIQRLSTTGHWEVPVTLPDGTALRLLIWYATPPVFDGPEDRNGRRNHDETAFWTQLIDGRLPFAPPASPFVVIGDANLDPTDGDGRNGAITALLAHPALQDPMPKGTAGRSEPGHGGDPDLDTADYRGVDGPGGLRVEYILPSGDLRVAQAGILWPPASDPLAGTLATASRHRPIWVDIALP